MTFRAMTGLLAGWLAMAGVSPASAVMTEGHKAGEWTMDFEAAAAYAGENNVPLFMAFSGSDWCGWCKLMDRQVFQTETWRDYAKKNLALVLLDFPRDPSLVPAKFKARNNEMREKYGVKGYPTYVLLDAAAEAEIGRFGAARDKTANILIDEIKQTLAVDTEVIQPAQDVSGRQEEDIVKVLETFGQAPPEDKQKLAAQTLATLTETLKKDPVLLVLLEPGALVGMVPYLNLEQLKVFTGHLNQARKAGTPIDAFLAELERLADERKDDLSTIRGLMFVYSNLGDDAKGLALLPGIEVLKQAETAARAKELIVVLKAVGRPKTALDLAFHMQNTLKNENERKAFCSEIFNLADEADDAFLSQWLAAVSEDDALFGTLQDELGQQAGKARDIQNQRQRSSALRGYARIVKLIGQKAPDKRLARQHLRYWQFEFANSLNKYHSVPSRQLRGARQQNPPPFVSFQVLLVCSLSPNYLEVLPPEEAELHRFQITVSRLKTGEFDEAALLELTAFNQRYPASVSEHCATFIEDWGKKVNPNKGQSNRARTYNARPPTGIPLTRARQEKNINDCARIFDIMRTAGVVVPDTVMLAGFRSCFSRAEIVSREAVLRVFPDVASLNDEFIGRLAADVIGELRENWMNAENRQVLQQQYGTNRTENDIDNETARAYRGMIELVRERLAVSENSLPLRNVMAALSFDLAEFLKLANLSTLEEYAELRDSTFRMFEESFTIYQTQLPSMTKKHYSVDYLKYWFSAVFGASDLAAATVNLEGNPSQLERIKAVLDSMEEPYRDAHKALFGEWIVGQWSELKPHMKLNVLQSTLEVLGHHDSVAPLVNRMDMYTGLLREVELQAEVDGSTEVGFGRPFGVVLKLRHTDALEREAGGFSKYIQNQGQPYPGARERIDYRNNFAENINKSFKDQFDVLGITWMNTAVHSVPTKVSHWRETPLAYVTMKALDATVDRIPSVQLDMDFRDDTGQVVLPILSNTVIIEAGTSTPPPRPVKDLEIRLVLDARQAAEEGIKLDVRMKGEGILPPVETLLRPASGYTFGPVVDSESIVLKLDQRGREVVAYSEDNTTLEIRQSSIATDGTFTFPEVTIDGARVILEQYKDADIVPADPTVAIHAASVAAPGVLLWVLPFVLIAVAGGASWLFLRRKPVSEAEETAGFAIPAEINGLSVVSLLERIRRSGRVAAGEEADALASDMRAIGEACFSVDRTGDIDLAGIAAKWVRRVS